MDWTFGIITGGEQEININKIIDSIDSQNIPKNKYEIIVVGTCCIYNKRIKKFPFDERIKKMWITKKKNVIAEEACFNNICFLHDYIVLEQGWYDNFINFGDNWDVCMNQILNLDNTRFRDWMLWTPRFVDYNDTSKIKEMYVSGSYFCAKKDFMLKYPFNENLSWGEGEDVEWSLRVRDFWDYKCNPNSIVKLLKQKQVF